MCAPVALVRTIGCAASAASRSAFCSLVVSPATLAPAMITNASVWPFHGAGCSTSFNAAANTPSSSPS
jgi:hypothetical protein